MVRYSKDRQLHASPDRVCMVMTSVWPETSFEPRNTLSSKYVVVQHLPFPSAPYQHPVPADSVF